MALKKKSFVVLSIVAGVLLGGCGDTSAREGVDSSKTPHQKVNRTFKDWTWDVGADITLSDVGFAMTTTYYSGMPDTTKHTQLFLDTTPNQGFNGANGWEVAGADYLVEDDNLYKSLSNTEWKWQYLGSAKVKTIGSGNDKRTLFTESSVLAKAIHGKKIDAYLETYDKDWNGEFKTVVLKGTSVSGKVVSSPDYADEEALKKTIKKALDRGFSFTVGGLALSPDHKTAVLDVVKRGYVSLVVFDVSTPTSPVKKGFVAHRDFFKMPYYSIENLKVLDDARVSYTLFERAHSHSTGSHLFAQTTGVVYDVVSNYVTKKVVSGKYTSTSKVDTRTIMRKKIQAIHGNDLTKFRFDYSGDQKYATVTIELNGNKTLSVDVYDLSDRANPVKKHHLVNINTDNDKFPQLSFTRHVNYYVSTVPHHPNPFFKYYEEDSAGKKTLIEIDMLTKKKL